MPRAARATATKSAPKGKAKAKEEAADKPEEEPKPAKKAAAKRGTKRAAEEPAEEKEPKPVKEASPPADDEDERPKPAAKRRRVAEPKAAPKPKPAPSLFPGQPALDLFMFGTNSFGALGLGDPEGADDPDTRSQIPRPKLPISETLKFVQVACGGMHTVGLTVDGDVYTWGVNDEGALGRKTSGTCWEKEPEKNKGDSFVPGAAALPGGLKAVQVAAGDGFTFAVGTDGALYGCGHFKDEVGALSGFTADVKVQGLFMQVWRPESLRDRIKKLVCGARHAVLLTNRGDVLTWGSGSQGQLGRVKPYHQDSEHQPTAEQLFKPTLVAHLPYALGSTQAVDVACGAYSTFVIGKNGAVAAWGLNNSGQLGIPKENNDDNMKWEPVPVASLKGVAHIAGGEQHTLALTKKGLLLSFGAATYGMLGRRDIATNTANEIHPDPKPVDGLPEGAKVECIAAGTNVSACTTSDGDAWFWGSNTNLQLAKGTDEDDETVPKKMGRVKQFGYRRVHFVEFGGQHGALLAGPQGEVGPAAGAGGSAAGAAAAAPAAVAPAAAAKPVEAEAKPAPAEAPKTAAAEAPKPAGESNGAAAAMEADAKPAGEKKEDGPKAEEKKEGAEAMETDAKPAEEAAAV
ncbi:hypothetical protein HYH02_003973 [Chlamydomonas schloesseri]|uniref:RCC1-like domain-containing protein n=1 Tax=Chlamydomonas schloesseri TaxID=2026947 RepID=A0A836B914_9CHLO|nr:hypothetical protein HYH02_003973 [Chlamydomonas schloesseri]|eukprot:KAG2451371.1 hypothetical protein HYH02_003973 [Chlamydomonas schloesseri]